MRCVHIRLDVSFYPLPRILNSKYICERLASRIITNSQFLSLAVNEDLLAWRKAASSGLSRFGACLSAYFQTIVETNQVTKMQCEPEKSTALAMYLGSERDEKEI